MVRKYGLLPPIETPAMPRPNALRCCALVHFFAAPFFFWKTLVALIERRVEAVSLADTVSNKQQKS